MRVRLVLLLGLLASTGTPPAHAASPDDPGATVPEARYGPITAGTRSYRPVEPLPWGEINRRVMPKDARPPRDDAQSPSRDATPQPELRTPQHKH